MNEMKKIFILLAVFAASWQSGISAQESHSDYILTPAAPVSPRINGAKVYGAHPGAEFLYRIPCTGERPVEFSAEGLPKGLKLDAATGIISGSVKKSGEYLVKLKAVNSHGKAERDFRIVIGDKIALTPPMGWNSWNCWGNSVSQEKVMSSARAMLDKGLVDYGWSYINIDDGWQGLRGGKDNAIQPNSKFPDMEGLGDFLHSNGLKFGIYSGPWVATYAGHIGESSDTPDGKYDFIEKGICDEFHKVDRSRMKRDSLWYFTKYNFVDADARQWAEWGVDYLKYDWHPNDEHNVRLMENALHSTGRDIVYSLSNGAKVGMASYLMDAAQCWRTTGDIRDNWDSMSKIGFSQDKWASFRRPGNWPDADMLVVGKVGWGPSTHNTKLTADEQYTHITLWSILGAPLLIGCDMAELDDFTLSLLCNSEVIDVNQDELGLQGARIYESKDYATYLKPLADGTVAVAMFNLSSSPMKIGFIPRAIGLVGAQVVRDLWRQQDVYTCGYHERWETEVAPHGCVLVKLTPVQKNLVPVGFDKNMK